MTKPNKIILRFRGVDKNNFDEIKKGLKTVETRAASMRYRDIKKGDIIIIVCEKQKITKQVKRARHFKNIESLLKAIPLKKIIPSIKSITDARKVYYGYQGYKEKIKEFGLIALELK